ncbi:MAG TPA: MraY family glycosyltransferase, partial [bacterium]|nr:MraY family glycosyltransferase [bacterium]
FKFIIILATAVFMLIIGIIDDIKHLKPLTKLICQIIAAIIVVFIAGVKIDFFRYNIINLIITICWIVIITNSFNLLDNMDGLSAGIAAISLFLFFIIAITQNEYNNALICLLLSFSAAGFLLFNYNPASIFMGDGGSLFLGFFVSVIAINNSYLKFSLLTRLPILIPVLVLFIPLYDTLSVIFIRRKLGISIFKADKRHFSHRLVNLGLSQRAAVLIIYLATLSTGITATLLTKLTLIDAIIIILHTFMVFGIIAILEWYSFKKNDNNI